MLRKLLSTQAVSRACATHPRRTIAAWLLAVAVSGVLIVAFLGKALTTQGQFLNNPESQQAETLLKRHFRSDTGPTQPNETIVIRSDSRTVDDPSYREYVTRVYSAILSLGDQVTEGGISYYQTGNGSLVSADRRTTIMPFIIKKPSENIGPVQDAISNVGPSEGFQVYTVGAGSIDREFLDIAEKDLSAELRVGIPAALVVLVIVFASVVSALVPLAIASVSVAITLALTAVIGQAFPFSFYVTNMITTMGLAVGIDYSLFIISRYREERRQGREKLDAISAAGATASRAVLFSGLTVVLALIGMFVVPVNVFRSLGAGAIMVALISILASLTLLPAVLGLLGDRVNALPLPGLSRSGPQAGGFWDRATRIVMRYPVISLVAAAGLLIAAAVPTFQLEMGSAGITTLPEHLQSRQGFQILQDEFNYGTISRVDVVIQGDTASPAVQNALERLKGLLASDSSFFVQQSTLRPSPEGDLALLTVPLDGDPNSRPSEDAVRRLRSGYIPQAFAGVPARALVTGTVAPNIDFFDIVAAYTPVVFALVLTLSFILLTVVFRSLVVPLKAILMNLLSVGAAYGLMVLVFQHGVGAGLLGFRQVDYIETWIPLFLFSILFGLSMDYHVFLLSRIRERFDQSHNNDEAVAFGLRTSAGIITGAALIIVAVFAGFASGELVMFQQLGFGVAVAVLLDATVVRSVLVPATMKLLGNLNWYLPRMLQWLPEVRVDRAEGLASAVPAKETEAR
ncbi:MAG: MMPL family transporter [Chloroflexi bacterium]|nr:MMPL family transporter [Chloroflexota bacterium]